MYDTKPPYGEASAQGPLWIVEYASLVLFEYSLWSEVEASARVPIDGLIEIFNRLLYLNNPTVCNEMINIKLN